VEVEDVVLEAGKRRQGFPAEEEAEETQAKANLEKTFASAATREAQKK
jgi:hypothetical protein